MLFPCNALIRDNPRFRQCTANRTRGNAARKANLQQRAVELIKQLSTEKLNAGVDYLDYLQDKEAWKATHELASDSEISKSLESNSTGKNPIAQRIIEAVEKSQDVTLDDAEILLREIKENQMLVRFDSPLAANKKESQ